MFKVCFFLFCFSILFFCFCLLYFFHSPNGDVKMDVAILLRSCYVSFARFVTSTVTM